MLRIEYLEGQEDLVSRLMIGIAGVIMWSRSGKSILTKYPWPSKYPNILGDLDFQVEC